MLVLFMGIQMSEPAHAATSKTKYVTASALNVRTGPSTHYRVVTTIKKNQSVRVTETKGSWDRITVGSKTGWASNKYLTTRNLHPPKKPTKVPTKKAVVVKTAVKSAATKTTTMYVTARSLNVRTGPSTRYRVVTTVKKNQAVSVISKGSWDKIKVGSKTGYVSAKYLTTRKPAAPKAPTNYAAKLKTVGSNKQLILVTANGYNTSYAQIHTYEKNSKGQWIPVLSTTGYIGKYGFATQSKMSEGGKRSPIGKYTIGTAFGRYNNPGTKLHYRKTTTDDVWVDDSRSRLYNTWQSKRRTRGQWRSAENMYVSAYNYGFVINYNTKRTPYKGSAIFFHVATGNYHYTLGCTATSQTNVVKILKWLDPKKNPVIIQTPTQELYKY